MALSPDPLLYLSSKKAARARESKLEERAAAAQLELTVAPPSSGDMSFCCFVPGQTLVPSTAFTQVSETRWVVELTAETPINELVAFITQPLAADQALSCHVASAPFEQAQWHFLGSVTNELPSIVFKTRYE